MGVTVLMLVCAAAFADSAKAETTGDWEGAKKAIIKAYKNYETEVDVSSYNLNYKTEYEYLQSTMSTVVNETPYLFYADTRYSVSRNSSTNQIMKIGLGYTAEYKKTDGSVRKTKIKNTRVKLDAAIEEALLNVEPGMTKVEKALVLHDYLVRNTAYTQDTTKQYRLTEVGVFLKNKANCQGYSLAYAILMEKVGIPVGFVSSDSMSHTWNRIKIGNYWYHVDVTWDDPGDAYLSQNQYGYVSHANFLCSDAKMIKTGHSDFSSYDSANTKYDSKYWHGVTGSFYYREGKWLYMTKSGVTEREKIVGGKKNVLYNISGNTFVQFNADKYYFIAYNNIYMYDYDSNSAEAVWKTSSKYSDEYTLTQIQYKNGKISYRVLYKKKYKSGTLTVGSDGKIVETNS